MIYDLTAPCYFGTESSAAFDFKRVGATDVTITDGRIFFKGDENVIAAANLQSRCAERVLIVLKKFTASTFDELFDAVNSVPWEDFMPANAEFPVKGSSLSSTLSSVPACQKIVKKAVVERLRKAYGVNFLPEDGPLYKIRFALRKNAAEIMLDTSGDGLHKRGYRKNSVEAPLKETLAAAIIDLGRIYPDTLALDPFCGSGTFIIEAAMKAMNMAPGLHRRFAGESFPFIGTDVWQNARNQAISEIRQDCEFEGVGFDIDPLAIELATQNARLAGVQAHCKFFTADITDFTPSPKAMVFTNPPYGERLGSPEEAFALENALGVQLRENPVRAAYIITANADFEAHFGMKAKRRRKLYNGMIPCQVYMYF